jgi:beta-xylosidase
MLQWRKIGEYVYFSASRNTENCRFFRTKDVVNGPYEEVCEAFPFWDPNLFCDDDGRLYFYWGCSSETPIWGVELDQNSMKPLGEKKALIFSVVSINGFEVSGKIIANFPEILKM